MDTQPQQSPSMIFYERPVLLNRDAHRASRLGEAPDVRFASRSNSFLLAARECADAMRDYPIVFVGTPGAAFTLAVLTGLHTDENLFVDSDGQWLEGRYLPAFVRRYPFVLVDGQEGAEEFQIAGDAACAWLDLEGAGTNGQRLLQDDGANTPYLDGIMDFMVRFHRGMRESSEFATHLHKLGILVKRVVEVKRGKKLDALENFWVVDERALRTLTAENLKELVTRGYMAWIYFHLASLANVQKLADLAQSRKAAIPAAPRPN